jgi:hypothetical protein
LEFTKQRFFLPRTFRENMAECRAMVRMKAPMMKIRQRSRKAFCDHRIHDMNEMLQDRF